MKGSHFKIQTVQTRVCVCVCECVCVFVDVGACVSLQWPVNHNKGEQAISYRINQSCLTGHRKHLCQQVVEQL